MPSLRWIDLPARGLMCLLFLLSGFGKLGAVSAVQGYMAAHGIPVVLIWPAAALEVGGGALLLVGLGTRPLALILSGWCVLTALIFHTAFGDQDQFIHFFKNMAMAGGFLVLARDGAPGVSVDSLIASRKTRAEHHRFQ